MDSYSKQTLNPSSLRGVLYCGKDYLVIGIMYYTFACMGIKDYKTVHNFAKSKGVTVGYIYNLIKDGKIKAEVIDGMKFIDTSKVKVKFKKK
jgi:hypothetical protein